MTPSGKSLFHFGIYLAFTGLMFVLIPDKLIFLIHLPPIPAGWARTIGLLVIIIGFYDILCGKLDIKVLIRASIYVRLGFALGSILLAIQGKCLLH